MKAKILGCYTFQSKAGKDLVNLSVTDERLNCFGVCTKNILSPAEVLPASPKDMINKTYLIDTNNNFASGFYELK